MQINRFCRDAAGNATPALGPMGWAITVTCSTTTSSPTACPGRGLEVVAVLHGGDGDQPKYLTTGLAASADFQ